MLCEAYCNGINICSKFLNHSAWHRQKTLNNLLVPFGVLASAQQTLSEVVKP